MASKSNKTSNKKVAKKVAKAAKKNPTAFIVIVIILIVLGVAGYVGYRYYQKQHDTCLDLNGPEYMSVALNSNYEEKGATAHYKGEDISNEIVTTYYLEDKTTVVESIKTDATLDFTVCYSIDHNDFNASIWRYVSVVDTDSISINFLELGNYHTGDCTYIKAGDCDILIDAGSKQESADTIDEYLKQPGRVEDGKLEYVIVTHAHEDHIAGFTNTNSREGIFARYEVGTIIEFAQSNNVGKSLYEKYSDARNTEIASGATWYTANHFFGTNPVRSPLFTSEDGLGANITMEVLYQKYYDELSSDENEHSVCVLFTQNENHYLFTGDLEEKGESSLVDSNTLPKVQLFKGGHHGSKTSNTTKLMDAIQPEVVCICCCAGNDEYTSNVDNQFPTQAAINRIGVYTDKIYVTTVTTDGHQGYESMNGNILFFSKAGKEYEVTGSNNNTILKDTDWFKSNRTWPTA